MMSHGKDFKFRIGPRLKLCLWETCMGQKLILLCTILHEETNSIIGRVEHDERNSLTQIADESTKTCMRKLQAITRPTLRLDAGSHLLV